MENNNRQGCRWTKAIQERIDYLKKADAEVCEKRWGNITRALERMVARETSNFLTERRHELEDLLRNMESIEPCATSSEKVNIVMKRIKQQEPDEAGWSYNSDFLREFTEKVNEKDWGEGLSMEQVESVLITAEEYEHEQLKSQTPSPTGDRDCEELKKEVERLKNEINELRNNK
jgi:hypothetical protein